MTEHRKYFSNNLAANTDWSWQTSRFKNPFVGDLQLAAVKVDVWVFFILSNINGKTYFFVFFNFYLGTRFICADQWINLSKKKKNEVAA